MTIFRLILQDPALWILEMGAGDTVRSPVIEKTKTIIISVDFNTNS